MVENIVELKSEEYKMLTSSELETTEVATDLLYHRIAFKFIVQEDQIGVIGVNVSLETIQDLLTKYLSQDKHIKLTVTGGDAKEAAIGYAESLQNVINFLKEYYPDQVETDIKVNSTIHSNHLDLTGEDFIQSEYSN